jgi:endo-1,4-beta-D-glucanase Y
VKVDYHVGVDQEVVKRSGRDEPMWVAIHKFMEATLGISLYSYLYPKLAKNVFLSSHVFSSTKLEKRVEQVQPRSGGLGVWERWHKQCIHM